MKKLVSPLIVFIVASNGWSQGIVRWTPPSAPVYVVSPNISSESLDPKSTKFGDLLMVQILPRIPDPPNGAERIDGGRYYQRGNLASLYVDGKQRGKVRIEAIKDHQCNSAAALVVPTVSGLLKIIGLATNADVRPRPGNRRDATASERTQAALLAAREFRRNKVAAPLMTRINVDKLTAIEVDESREKTLVGSFYVQTKTERHDVFLIVRENPSGLALEYADYGRTEDLADFTDHKSILFIDHLDLNNDGSDEIVLRIGGYESERYDTYARRAGKWRRVATSFEAGC